MSSEEQGFLSPEMAAWIDKHHAENRAWFNLAMNLNSVAQRQLLLLGDPSEDENAFLAGLLFIRGLSSFQAAILLAERGMIQDARTITRSCLETIFVLGALRADPDLYGVHSVKWCFKTLHNLFCLVKPVGMLSAASRRRRLR